MHIVHDALQLLLHDAARGAVEVQLQPLECLLLLPGQPAGRLRVAPTTAHARATAGGRARAAGVAAAHHAAVRHARHGVPARGAAARGWRRGHVLDRLKFAARPEHAGIRQLHGVRASRMNAESAGGLSSADAIGPRRTLVAARLSGLAGGVRGTATCTARAADLATDVGAAVLSAAPTGAAIAPARRTGRHPYGRRDEGAPLLVWRRQRAVPIALLVHRSVGTVEGGARELTVQRQALLRGAARARRSRRGRGARGSARSVRGPWAAAAAGDGTAGGTTGAHYTAATGGGGPAAGAVRRLVEPRDCRVGVREQVRWPQGRRREPPATLATALEVDRARGGGVRGTYGSGSDGHGECGGVDDL